MSVGQYTEELYTEHLHDLIVADLPELNNAIADLHLSPLVPDDVLVAPPSFQISDAMIFIWGGAKRHPESKTQAEHEEAADGTTYVKWARHVVGQIMVQPQITMMPDATSMHAATRGVTALTAELDRLFLRVMKEDGWWAWLDNPDIGPVQAMRPRDPNATYLVAARQFQLNVRVKEFVSTLPQV